VVHATQEEEEEEEEEKEKEDSIVYAASVISVCYNVGPC